MRSLMIAALLIPAAASQATLLDIYSCECELASAPDGFVVNDLFIDFEGQLFGQQMIVQLDSGSIYQNSFGGETAPNDALITPFPELAADTFVTIGGATTATSSDVIVVGGSTEFAESSGAKVFDDTGIDVAWAPAPGVVIEDQTHFMVARLTLSDDASGRIFYFGNGTEWLGGGTFVNGRPFEFLTPFDNPRCIPEPSACVLLGLSVTCLGASRRRSAVAL